MQNFEPAGLLPTSARSLAPLRLCRPRSVREAVDGLADCERPVVLAGGTDLVAQYNDGLSPGTLVDVSRLDELRAIERVAGTQEALADRATEVLRIGALVTHHVGSGHPLVRAASPGFADAWKLIANPRIRSRATLGGNVMSRRTRYEGSLLLTALDARCVFETEAGRRESDMASVWIDEWVRSALLTGFEIELAGLLCFDYERSLRPMLTQALALRRIAGGVRIRLSVATEYLRPVVLELDVEGVANGDAVEAAASLAPRSRELARAIFAMLPDGFRDPIVTTAYARRAGAALLARQLETLHV